MKRCLVDGRRKRKEKSDNLDIWTIIIVCGIGYLVLSFLGSKLGDFKMPNIPFLNQGNSTEDQPTESNPLPEPVQKGIDILGKSYNLPLWLLVLICVGLIWIAKR